MSTLSKVTTGIVWAAVAGGVYLLYRALSSPKVQATPEDNTVTVNNQPAQVPEEDPSNDQKVENSSVIGKPFISRTKNTFKGYVLKEVSKDKKQSDGTFKRVKGTEYVKSGKKHVFKDGELIGNVVEETGRGFYLKNPAGITVWAPKRLLTA